MEQESKRLKPGDRYILAPWSDLARNGRAYREAIEAGERIIILHRGDPIATIEPIDPDGDYLIAVDGRIKRSTQEGASAERRAREQEQAREQEGAT